MYVVRSTKCTFSGPYHSISSCDGRAKVADGRDGWTIMTTEIGGDFGGRNLLNLGPRSAGKLTNKKARNSIHHPAIAPFLGVVVR